jgi:ABC-type dipeptide/oligopeptide/nickel transport system permease subunit
MLTLPTVSSAASISTLLSLNANDYVDTAIRVGASTVNIYMGHSEFVGYLIG